MNLYANTRNECKIAEKSRGILTKLLISQLQIALEYQTCYQSNAQTKYSRLIVRYEKKESNFIFMNFNENTKNKWKFVEKLIACRP